MTTSLMSSNETLFLELEGEHKLCELNTFLKGFIGLSKNFCIFLGVEILTTVTAPLIAAANNQKMFFDPLGPAST